MQNIASQCLVSVKPETASGVVKITQVPHWGFAANDPRVHQGCSECSYDIASVKLFPGQYFDSETELHYNYFRDYDPSIGRYIQSDLIGLRGGINTYAYVGGNPLMHSDALGLITSGEAGAIGSAIGGAIGGGINGALTGAAAGAPGGVPGVVGGAIGGGIVGGAVGGATGLASGAASASLGAGGATGAGLVTGGLVGGAAGLAGEAVGAVIPGPGGAIASGTIGGALGGIRGGGATVVGGAIGGAIGGIISAALCYASAECRNETGCD